MFFAVLILATALVQASIQVCGDKDFKTTESVSVKSVGKICYNAGETVKLYIVEDRNALELAILQSKDVPNSQFPCTKIWESADIIPGDFDVFADCNSNGLYDLNANEPFDSFNVTATKGTGSASLGAQNIGNHTWIYNSEEDNLINEMIQIALTAKAEDIALNKLAIKAAGSGDDTQIEKISVYIDANNNGKFDSSDTAEEEIGNGVYTSNDGLVEIEVAYTLKKDVQTNILIVYTMKKTTPTGEFSFAVNSIIGTGIVSEEAISFSGTGTLLNSGTKTVLSAEICVGALILNLIPNSVMVNESATAKVSGLTGCEGKRISLRINSCSPSSQEELGSCTIGEDGAGCDASIVASKNATVYSCIDKNQDNDMTDFGEYNFQNLIVNEPEKTAEEETGETSKQEVENETNITEEGKSITGEIVGELKEKVAGTSTLFLFLEVTLLLILLVLVMILFKLKGSRSEGTEESKEEKAEE